MTLRLEQNHYDETVVMNEDGCELVVGDKVSWQSGSGSYKTARVVGTDGRFVVLDNGTSMPFRSLDYA